MIKLYHILTFLCVAIIAVSGESIKFNIVTTADIHGNFVGKNSGIVALSNIVENVRKANPKGTFVLDSGDLIQGNAVNKLEKGKIIIEAMNLIGIDFMTIGNHEVDFGIDNFIKVYSEAKSVLLAANMECDGLEILPYKVVNSQGVKLAFIGIAERNLRNRMYEMDARLKFYDNDEAIYSAVVEILKENVDIIVLLSHDGLYFRGGTLYKFINKFPMIDIVIGGHTHQQEIGQKIGNCYFVQTAPYAKSLINIEIEYDLLKKKISRINSKLIRTTLNDVTIGSEKFADLISEWNELKEEAKQPLRISEENFVKDYGVVENILLDKMKKSIPKANVYVNFLQKYDKSAKYDVKNINLFLYHKLFPFEESFHCVQVTKDEYNLIIKELAKIAKKYDYQLFIHTETNFENLEKINLVTSGYILSGCTNPENPIKNAIKNAN